MNFPSKNNKGIPERMEYLAGSGSRVMIPDAELQLCDLPCETENVTVRMSLATHHIGKGCDRDTYSIESQRKLCGKCQDFSDSKKLSDFFFSIRLKKFVSIYCEVFLSKYNYRFCFQVD